MGRRGVAKAGDAHGARGLGRRGRVAARALVLAALLAAAGCGTGETGSLTASSSESCMMCHNASPKDDYAGPGIENPHPFPGADNLRCTVCHGGNPDGDSELASHVPPPPEIGDEDYQESHAHAWFNRLTLAGMDTFPDYQVGGVTYTALDYLQFVNPGDLRVVQAGRACGQCHEGHAEDVAASLLATEAGILAGAAFAIGAESKVPESQGLYEDTAADLGFRGVEDFDYMPGAGDLGSVARLIEYPVFSVHGQSGGDNIHNSDLYLSPGLADDRNPDNSVISGSPLANLFHEQIAFTCGDCHLGSAGANNRYGDFRSSGCSACHMPYSQDGRSKSSDPNVAKFEPLDPDDIDPPERAHPRSHRIRSVHKTLPGGVAIEGIDDHTCAGCHQGSNRTVMQYWGIRLDQNQDVRNHFQYPANPVTFVTTHDDPRLFDPVVDNNTFNGRNANQYLLFEDYDGDGRDDTPADVHYEAGLGCIDCHGSYDLHGGDVTTPGTQIRSRMEQAVAIRCESCHGTIDAYADAATGTAFDGSTAELALDARGNLLDHVVKEADGTYYLTSRLTGARHYVPQTMDTVVDSGKQHPDEPTPLYSAQASYAMGRTDADPANGIGPLQTGGVTPGFSHTDRMDCASCHAAWTNTCMGCHLEGEYDTGNNFSNITGQRIVFREREADFTYQTPVPFQLGVGPDNRITQFSANTKVFFTWQDRNGVDSQAFTFSDRNGAGNDPTNGLGALSHNAMMAHSIRGKVNATDEGPRYCVACHLTDDGLADFGLQEYLDYRTALASDLGALDFDLLTDHIGRNPGNQLNSPVWVHMVAGLGSGLFLFDANGAPVNPIDFAPDRKGTDNVPPGSVFDVNKVVLNLDRLVGPSGASQASSNHALLEPGVGPNLRDGASDPNMAGPLGQTLIQRLTDPATGIVLDSWIDANGDPQGDAASFLD